jgi:concanavalin A-like lectin/glucanase superfamily protein
MPPPPPSTGPLGVWSFDDCNPSRTNLNDSGPNGDTAFRTVSTACAPGIANLAVTLAKPDEDLVYVPDQPFFDFSHGVTVAGWFNPTSTTKTHTLFRKRDNVDSSSFALLLNNGKYQIVINLGQGRAASITAPTKATVGQWAHVAATYDNSTLRLYLNGVEVGNFNVAGTLAPAAGPFLMGNDGTKRVFAGQIDNAFLDARALSPDEVLKLTCLHKAPTLVGTPAVSAPTQPDVPATFDIAVTNNDSAICGPSDFIFFNDFFQPGFNVQPNFQSLSQVAPGTSAHVHLSVSAADSVGPDTFTIPFQVFSQNSQNGTSGSVQFVLAAATGCHVTSARELMITSTSVVDDPVRTNASNLANDPRAAAWTLKRLLENMAPTPADAPSMLEDMLKTFTTQTSVNGFTIDARPGFGPLLASWPRDAKGQLDLTKAPVMLQAIVNRFDLRNQANGDAGEGRFVFAFVQNGQPLQATLIFEYKLPATTDADVLQWANAWHALGATTFPSEDYNAALQAITDKFSGRGVRPGHPNGNAINAVRTNEIDFGGGAAWQLREFVLSPTTGRLVPATIQLTPDLSFKNTQTLATFINQNQAAVIAETDTVPDTFQGAPFLAGAVFNDLSPWFAPGVDPEARFHFSLNTCNGCHSAAETNTPFLQITPRFPGAGEARLSGFLTGTTVPDPQTGQPRAFNDLHRRAVDLQNIVCTPTPAKKILRKGISRVH